MDKKKALIGMSGGVDSSVAAFLTLRSGYDCIGATMRLHDNAGDADTNTCCTLEDVEDARAVARRLGIPFHVFNFKEDFARQVMDKFVRCYEAGLTPNPCIDCNKHLKFDRLYESAEALGCDGIATGHYAQIEYDSASGIYYLKKARDLSKDQSYVLYSLTQEQLARTLFPLGALTKDEVRKIAAAHGFINADKRDSQDICFIPDGDYAAFIERQTGDRIAAGNYLDRDGNIIGRHRGHIHYTVGQRKGLGISSERPLYVIDKDAKENTVTLSHGEGLFTRSLDACDINLITVPRIETSLRVKAKIRYRQAETWATVYQTDTDRLHLEFDEEQRAIARGQAVVLYDGDIVVGGGTILGFGRKLWFWKNYHAPKHCSVRARQKNSPRRAC